VVQTLENQPTASPGWDPFGDVILKRTPLISEKGKDISPEKRNSPLLGVEGLRSLRSFLSFDLEALDRLAAYLIYASLVAPWRSRLLHGISQVQLAVI
jgi:hypothetical protein